MDADLRFLFVVRFVIGGKGAWSRERDTQLAKLWRDGLPSTEIGRRMGITKNAALGRIHRLKLQPRRSPIQIHSSAEKAVLAQAKAARRAAKITLPSLLDPIGSGARIAPRGSRRQEWTGAEMVRIRALVSNGASLTDIGRDFGLARETVRCRFKRLGLATHWRPAGDRRVRTAPLPGQATGSRGTGAIKGNTLPASRIKSDRITPVDRQHSTGTAARMPLAGVTLPGIAQQPMPVAAYAGAGRVSKCAFLHGVRYGYWTCDVPTAPSKSYCPEHQAICYVPERVREVAA